MNPLKRLASQTAIYGGSSVIGRFLNYLLVPLYTYSFAPPEYAVVIELYAYMGFLAVLLAFGLETGYFRFREGGEWPAETVYATALRFLIGVNGVFFLLAFLSRQPIAELLRYPDHPEYIVWVAAILALDSMGAIVFARLRAEGRAVRFALIKVTEIGINIGLNLFFILGCRQAFEADPTSFLGRIWDPNIGIGYVFLANLAASTAKLVLLAPQLGGMRGGFDRALFGRLIRYSLPMVVIGFAGIVNDMLDRAALKYLLPFDLETNMRQLGIYGACYKLAVLMTLFVQAFRYAGEPFFFAYAKVADARETYARVLNYFVICCVLIFLVISLFLEVFQYLVGAAYREGLTVVPVLLLANLLLGIYVNLSIWYKLTDRTLIGAWVALAGSAITLVLLLWWVPHYGYVGAAWAHLVCYSSMVLLSYALGRRYYPVPYRVGRVLGYLGLGVMLFWADRLLVEQLGLMPVLSATLCVLLFLALAFLLDGRRLLRRRSGEGR